MITSSSQAIPSIPPADPGQASPDTSVCDPKKRAAAIPAGDIWALGVTMVEASTRSLPVWPGERSAPPACPRTLPGARGHRAAMSESQSHRQTDGHRAGGPVQTRTTGVRGFGAAGCRSGSTGLDGPCAGAAKAARARADYGSRPHIAGCNLGRVAPVTEPSPPQQSLQALLGPSARQSVQAPACAASQTPRLPPRQRLPKSPLLRPARSPQNPTPHPPRPTSLRSDQPARPPADASPTVVSRSCHRSRSALRYRFTAITSRSRCW